MIDLTEKVISGQARNAFAVVRPPGHHAETDQAMGFCMYNNVAVAARVARDKFNVQRVLIVDWDIHHGNGTEHMFENDPSVMYCSLHRFDRYVESEMECRNELIDTGESFIPAQDPRIVLERMSA